MKKLAISIVTYNRAKHIREDLSAIAQPTKECDIDIYIYDGSTDILTEQVANQYIEKGNSHIHYFHIGQSLPTSESFVKRLECAIHMPEAEYVWLSGDKFMIRPEHYSEIFPYIEKSYDIITIYGNILNGTRKFNRASSFLDYAIVPITHIGSTIIKKKLIESYNIQQEMKAQPAFGPQFIYLQAIAKCEDFKGIVIDAGNQANVMSRYNTKSGSTGRMWSTWVLWWYSFIKSLPSAYDDVRGNLYNRPDLQMFFFSFKELLRQRSEGQFDCKKYWEYREYVKKVIVMPHIFVFCISLLPKNFAKWLWSNYDYGKRICSWAKSGVKLIGEKL